MEHIRIDKAAAKKRISPIDHLVNSLLMAEITRYKQLVNQHNELRGDSMRRSDYSQVLFEEAKAFEGAREAYATTLGLLEDFVASAENQAT